MSESDRAARKKQSSHDMNRDSSASSASIREDLNQRRNEELAACGARQPRHPPDRRAEKFDLILQEAVFASPRIDITDKVIKALATESPGSGKA